jgi:hypothetical protein
MTHASQRPLTVDEWQERLNNARNLLGLLERDVAVLIDACDQSDPDVVDAIHSAAGKLGSLSGHVALAQRRIDRGLV